MFDFLKKKIIIYLDFYLSSLMACSLAHQHIVNYRFNNLADIPTPFQIFKMGQNFHRLCSTTVLVPVSAWLSVIGKYQKLRDRMLLHLRAYGYAILRADGVIPFGNDDKAGKIPCRCFCCDK